MKLAVPWWRKGDLAAFFALFTNNLTNLLTVIALLTVVVGLPADMVFKRVVPAFGLAVLLASIAYVYFAHRLAKRTGRHDVVALPSGPAAPAIFTITFLVLLPVFTETNDPNFAIGVALVWGFFENVILLVGAFLGDWLRRAVPRTVLLSCLAGLGLLLLAMNPMLQSFETPVVAFVVLALIFMNWFGRKPIFKRIPTGLLLLVIGTALGWAFGLMSPGAIQDALASAGFSPPQFHGGDIFTYFQVGLPYLASAVPLALANFVFDIENIEGAHASGDPYPTRPVIAADAGAGLIGNALGNPFPVTVYVGHTAYKEMGAGVGYTLLNGIAMFLVSILGLGSLLLSIIPMAAIAPILIFIGVVTANQVVRETPKIEVPVIFIALFPWIANWGLTLAGNVMKASGTNAGEVGREALMGAGTNYNGLYALGNGAPLTSLLWGCIAIFAIKNKPVHGAVSAAVAAVLAYFGIIHEGSPVLGGEVPTSFLVAYLMVAALFLIKWVLERNDPEDGIGVATDDADTTGADATDAAVTAGARDDRVAQPAHRGHGATADGDQEVVTQDAIAPLDLDRPVEGGTGTRPAGPTTP